ncbi:MAG: hypothetical protein K2M46_06710 [Lachnospiraceae bacterium]|nr:hypothetical protein [Lachnospiraceae bacterium]
MSRPVDVAGTEEAGGKEILPKDRLSVDLSWACGEEPYDCHLVQKKELSLFRIEMVRYRGIEE